MPRRSEDIADQSLRYYRAQYPEEFVPLPLLRELLEEAAHLDDLASNASLLGNRVTATWLGSEELLICSPAEDIGQTLRLSVLHGSHVDRFQVTLDNVAEASFAKTLAAISSKISVWNSSNMYMPSIGWIWIMRCTSCV